MAELNKLNLEKYCMIRDIYRALFQNNRTYAGFEIKRIIPLVENLAHHKIILDPMAGYGGLIEACQKNKKLVSAFCIEYNPPAYFWQILSNPNNSEKLIKLCHIIYNLKDKWPSTEKIADSSNYFFTDSSFELLKELYELCLFATDKIDINKNNQIMLALAFLLPFVGRFSSCVQGNIVTHVKIGGMVVFLNWEDNFLNYIEFLEKYLGKKQFGNNKRNHISILGNSKKLRINDVKFKAMITSPPYPNSRSYSGMFGPENEFLKKLENEGYIKNIALRERLIGSPKVSVKKNEKKINISDVKSHVAKKFLKNIESYDGKKYQKYDNKIYYIPFYSKYFHELEIAYENIALMLDDEFEGYIIVVDNTCRKEVVPVAQFIEETWKRMGFNASTVKELTREISHVGGINPRVKGFTARHNEYTIRINR